VYTFGLEDVASVNRVRPVRFPPPVVVAVAFNVAPGANDAGAVIVVVVAVVLAATIVRFTVAVAPPATDVGGDCAGASAAGEAESVANTE
jgi:hypothetical protein